MTNDDEDKNQLLLSFLFRSFEHFNDVILYDKEDIITLDEVTTVVRSKTFSEVKYFNINDR